MQYKTTNYWNKDSERSLKWNDPNIAINWPIEKLKEGPFLSKKDNAAESLKVLEKLNSVFL